MLAYVALSFLTQKTMETKKFIAVACLQPEIGTDIGDVMTTWRHGVMSSACNYMQLSSRHWSERVVLVPLPKLVPLLKISLNIFRNKTVG